MRMDNAVEFKNVGGARWRDLLFENGVFHSPLFELWSEGGEWKVYKRNGNRLKEIARYNVNTCELKYDDVLFGGTP